MEHLSPYFDNYAYISPARKAYIKEQGNEQSGYAPETLKNMPNLTIVTSESHPKLYEAITEECSFRRIDPPAFYIDSASSCRLGYAIPSLYAVHVEKEAYNRMNKQELRALVAHEIKHLFQHPSSTPEESCLNEYDSDRAAVTSTDYETIRSYVQKAAHMQIDRALENHSTLRAAANLAFSICPNLVTENFFIKLDAFHPSPASRMAAMYKHSLLPPM